jgi:RNA polymerase-binding transcription factor DksA
MNTTIRRRLEKDLLTTGARLRQFGRVVAIDELPGVIGDNSSSADEVDGSQTTTSREIGWTTRELLVERVKRLSDALHRLREGTYGVCIHCDERLSPARLRAMPEVETCVGCQSSLERLDRQAGRSREPLFSLTGTEGHDADA